MIRGYFLIGGAHKPCFLYSLKLGIENRNGVAKAPGGTLVSFIQQKLCMLAKVSQEALYYKLG